MGKCVVQSRLLEGRTSLYSCFLYVMLKQKKEERTMNEQKHKVMILKRISKEAVSAETLRLLCQNLMVEVLKYQQHR